MKSVNHIQRRRFLHLGARGGLAGYFFVAPSLIFLGVFVILPIVAAFYYSVTDYDLMSAPKFATYLMTIALPMQSQIHCFSHLGLCHRAWLPRCCLRPLLTGRFVGYTHLEHFFICQLSVPLCRFH